MKQTETNSDHKSEYTNLHIRHILSVCMRYAQPAELNALLRERRRRLIEFKLEAYYFIPASVRATCKKAI